MTTYENDKTLDIIGVGIGPFNLSLAALSQPIKTLNCIFFESKPKFNWHPGLLMEDCTLQVPMMADLVTMADPTNQYSYLNYLHATNRLYHFYFYEDFKIPRRDYNLYCQWVSEQLESLEFSSLVTEINEQNGLYTVSVLNQETQKTTQYRSKNVVLGIGTEPNWPKTLNNAQNEHRCCHSADYLNQKNDIQKSKSITVIGAGQSAAEIVLDLLNEQVNFGYDINWLTRSNAFLPMEYSKLGLEHFSPDYIDYFHRLNEQERNHIVAEQDLWYKGISIHTIEEIHTRIYRRSITEKNYPITIQALSELEHIEATQKSLILTFFHRHQKRRFTVHCDQLILATGHTYKEPQCLSTMNSNLKRDHAERLQINRHYQIESLSANSGHIYVQNGELHSHGIGAPDLGLGAYRSATIINTITKKKHYKTYKKNVFQQFGIAEKWKTGHKSSKKEKAVA